MTNSSKNLLIVFFILVGIFVYFTYKNIQYPLMWGDEAETALYSDRVLTFGYPKIHSGSDSYKLVMVSGDVGVNKKYDANTTSLWGQYYFGAIGQALARSTPDLYLKTALLRIPFATIGLLGVFLLPLSLLFFVNSSRAKIIFLTVYVIIQIVSISLILHLREVRSYSLAVFLSSGIVYCFINYYFRKGLSEIQYVILQSLLLILLFHSFPPGFLALAAPLGFYVFIDSFLGTKASTTFPEKIFKTFNRRFWVVVIPIIFSVILAIPVVWFFETAKYSANAYKDIHYGLNTYLIYLGRIYLFLFKHHYLVLAMVIKGVEFYLLKKYFPASSEKGIYFRSLAKISSFLFILLIAYTLLVATIPFMFDRYYVFLQPLLGLIIVFDLYLNYRLLHEANINKEQRSNLTFNYLLFTALIFVVTTLIKMPTISGYIYQLTNRYVGPMDEVVAYIKQKYPSTDKIAIDTTIEQPVLVYYLQAKVLCDDVQNCFSSPPEIILPRRALIDESFVKRTNNNLAAVKYEQVVLPIRDYPSNNIPEFTLALRHLFKSPYTSNNNEKIVLFVKK